MASRFITRWPDLPGVVAVRKPFHHGVQMSECRFHVGAELKLRVLLLPEQMYSLTWCADFSDGAPPAMLALGRVIAMHAGPAADAGRLGAEVAALEDVGRGQLRPSWSDLPAVAITPPHASGRLACFGLRSGEDVATLYISIDPAVPIGCAEFSTNSPARWLLVAVGRLAMAHAEALQEELTPRHAGWN